MTTILLFGSTVFAEEKNSNYRINGKVENANTGKIILLTIRDLYIDTLGVTAIRNGYFELQGKVQDVLPAYIQVAGQENMIPIMLENTAFQIAINANRATVVGGKAQQLYNEFNAIGQNLAREQTAIQTEYNKIIGNHKKMASLQNRLDSLLSQSLQKIYTTLQAHADQIVSGYVVYLGMEGDDPEILKKKYALLAENIQNSPYGEKIAERIAAYDLVAVGAIAPDFTAQTPEGNKFTLHGTIGEVKLLTFWTSWSIACRQENVELISIYQKYRPRGLEIISVSLDDNLEDWKKAIGEDGMIWENASDLKGLSASPIAKTYFIQMLPYTLLLDKENRIIAKDLHGNELRKVIADLTQKKKK